jgi:hypothetical protein
MWDKWFPTLDSAESAKQAARQGGLGGLLFAGSYLIGIIFVAFFKTSPVDKSAVAGDDALYWMAASAVLTAAIFLLAWRVSTGKGWVSAGILLIWFVLEIATKIVGGTTNIGWMFAYAAVAAMLFNGLRACWWLRQASRPMPTRSQET